MTTIKYAGFLFWCPATKSIFLARRAPWVPQPGLWGCPGGSVDREDIRTAGSNKNLVGPITAHREALEELSAVPEHVEIAASHLGEEGYATYVVLNSICTG